MPTKTNLNSAGSNAAPKAKYYICTTCGKEFDYPPALSRSDNRSYVCRICSAREALEAAGIDGKEEVLDEKRRIESCHL